MPMQPLPMITTILGLSEKIGGVGYWVYDASQKAYWFSENLKSLLATEPDDLEIVTERIRPEDLPFFAETLHAIDNQKPVPSGELQLATTGESVHIRQYGYIYNESGTQYSVGVWQDISLEKKCTEGIHFFERLIDASIDGIMVLDTDLNIILWNRSNELFNGIQNSEAIGKNILQVKPSFAKAPEVAEAIQHALLGYSSFIPAGKNENEKGYFEDHLLPLRNDDNEVIGVLNIRHDVAHRVKAENALKELNHSLRENNKQLKRRNTELQVYSHITSHDFKGPLRKVYTVMEMIVNQEAGNFSDKGKQHIRQLQGAVQRIGLLADDILAYSRLENQETSFEKVDLNEVMELCVRRLDEHIKQTNAQIDYPLLPAINGHKLMLLQLFYKLLSNAIKFQETGNQPVVSIKAGNVQGAEIEHPDADPQINYLKLSFSDNGIGIKRKYYNRIFDVFMRISKTRYTGSGTGLALARKIAELHNGFITVESEPGKGSRFDCYLQNGL